MAAGPDLPEMNQGFNSLEVSVKLGRLPVGHKPHPPSSPRSLPILSGVVDVSQEKRLPGVLAYSYDCRGSCSKLMCRE